jgi:hypothetical protein
VSGLLLFAILLFGDRLTMPTLEDVYCKFGFAAEAAHVLETQLGNMLLLHRAIKEDLIGGNNPERARVVWDSVTRQTIGQLLKNLTNHSQSLDRLNDLLLTALKERNRLFHSFYTSHNFRKNSEEGRLIMLQDLEGIHTALLGASKALLLLKGIDLDAIKLDNLPTGHLLI